MENRDIVSAKNWQESYDLKTAQNLWGNDFVPFIDQAVDHFKSVIDGRFFLDLPCGDGRNLSVLSKNLPIVLGADYSVNALEISNKRLKAEKCNNTLLHSCDIFKTGYLDDQFDGIFCWDLLGHLVNVKDAIMELFRILKPNGTLICSIFSDRDSTINDPQMTCIGKNEFIYRDKFYFKYYNEAAINQLLEKMRLNIISIKKVGWTEDPHEGYREYPHYHESWALILKKT